MKKAFSFILTLVMLVTFSTSFAFAGSSDRAVATSMRIAGIDGTVSVTSDKGKDIKAKADTRLLTGYTIKTGTASYCFISLDDAKAIKLDQNTKVTVEKSGKQIELILKSGEIYFDVAEKLSGNESMNIKTSNMTTGIRGTSGVIKISSNDLAAIDSGASATKTEVVLLGGKLVVDTAERTEKMAAGEMLVVFMPLEKIGGEKAAKEMKPVESLIEPEKVMNTETMTNRMMENKLTRLATDSLGGFTVRAAYEVEAMKSGMKVEVALGLSMTELEKAVDESKLPEALQENPAETQKAADTADAEIANEEAAAQADIQAREAENKKEVKENLANMEKANEEIATTVAISGGALEPEELVDQVFEPSTTNTSKGTDAESAIFKPEDKGPQTAATGGAVGGGSGGGGSSGGSPAQTFSITFYSGVYDGAAHSAMAVANAEAYDMYYFSEYDTGDKHFTGFCQDLADTKYYIAEEEARHPGDPGNPTYGAVLEEMNVRYADPCASIPSVTDVVDSGTFYYYGLSKTEGGTDITGSGIVNIDYMPIEAVWTYFSDMPEIRREPATPGAALPISVISAIGSIWPVEATVSPAAAGAELLLSDDVPVAYSIGYSGTVRVVAFSDPATGNPITTYGNFKIPDNLTFSFSVVADPITEVTYRQNDGNTLFSKWENGAGDASKTDLTAADVVSEINRSTTFERITVEGGSSSPSVLGSITLPTSAREVTFTNNLSLEGLSYGSSLAYVRFSYANAEVAGTVTVPSGASIYIDGDYNSSTDEWVSGITTFGGLTVDGNYGGACCLNCGQLNISGEFESTGEINCTSMTVTGTVECGDRNVVTINGGSLSVLDGGYYKHNNGSEMTINTTSNSPGIIISGVGSKLENLYNDIIVNASNSNVGISVSDGGELISNYGYYLVTAINTGIELSSGAKIGGVSGMISITAAACGIKLNSEDAVCELSNNSEFYLNSPSMVAFDYSASTASAISLAGVGITKAGIIADVPSAVMAAYPAATDAQASQMADIFYIFGVVPEMVSVDPTYKYYVDGFAGIRDAVISGLTGGRTDTYVLVNEP